MLTTVLTTLFCLVAAAWALTPFALFGVRNRLARVEDAYRRNTEELTAELNQLHASLKAHGDRLFLDPVGNDSTLLVRRPLGRA